MQSPPSSAPPHPIRYRQEVDPRAVEKYVNCQLTLDSASLPASTQHSGQDPATSVELNDTSQNATTVEVVLPTFHQGAQRVPLDHFESVLTGECTMTHELRGDYWDNCPVSLTTIEMGQPWGCFGPAPAVIRGTVTGAGSTIPRFHWAHLFSAYSFDVEGTLGAYSSLRYRSILNEEEQQLLEDKDVLKNVASLSAKVTFPEDLSWAYKCRDELARQSHWPVQPNSFSVVGSHNGTRPDTVELMTDWTSHPIIFKFLPEETKLRPGAPDSTIEDLKSAFGTKERQVTATSRLYLEGEKRTGSLLSQGARSLARWYRGSQ